MCVPEIRHIVREGRIKMSKWSGSATADWISVENEWSICAIEVRTLLSGKRRYDAQDLDKRVKCSLNSFSRAVEAVERATNYPLLQR